MKEKLKSEQPDNAPKTSNIEKHMYLDIFIPLVYTAS